MRSVLVAAFLVALTSPAFAQPGLTPPLAPSALSAPSATGETAPPTSAKLASRDAKDPSIAVLLSLGVTTGGVITLLAAADDSEGLAWVGLGAMYFGPSTGRWYAGESGGVGLGLRALGAATALIGVSQLLASEYSCDFDYDCTAERERADRAGTRAALLLTTGAGLWVGSTIADIVLAKRGVDRWNKRHALSVAPTALTSRDGHVPGLVLAGRF